MKFANLHEKIIYSTKTENTAIVLDASVLYKLHRPGPFLQTENRQGRAEKVESRRYENPRVGNWTQGVLVLSGFETRLDDALNNPAFDAFVERVTSGKPFAWDTVLAEFFGEGHGMYLSCFNPAVIDDTRDNVRARLAEMRKDAARAEQARQEKQEQRQVFLEQINRRLAAQGIVAQARLETSTGDNLVVSGDVLERLLGMLEA